MKGLEGRPPWLRLRIGDWRVIFRPLDDIERAGLSQIRGESVEPGTLYVDRVVNRRDLERIYRAAFVTAEDVRGAVVPLSLAQVPVDDARPPGSRRG